MFQTHRVHSGASFAIAATTILDQITITVSKSHSLQALKIAEGQFSKNAILIRQNNGPEQLAEQWEEQAAIIHHLITQIESNGGQIARTRN